MRLGAFVLPYSAIEKVISHGNTKSRKDWMQFTLNEQGANLVPLGYISRPTFYLLVKHDFCNSTILKIQKITENLELDQIKARNKRRKDKEEALKNPQAPNNEAAERNEFSDSEEEEKKKEEASIDGQSTAAETAAGASETQTVDGSEAQSQVA